MLNIIGIMTGNSLDAADLVLTKFAEDGTQTDLLTHSLKSPEKLKDLLRWVRTEINEAKGDVALVASKYQTGEMNFQNICDEYINFIAEAVNELVHKAKEKDASLKIDLIGFHGQTCSHCPPSIAKTKDKNALYTVQIGDGQKLADLTGISVIYDFRSDDLMNLGEAAPLAPIHHQHLAEQTRKKGQFPIAFCNAGNTGNITIITEDKMTKELQVRGWDTGPFNNFPDKLMHAEKSKDCDENGDYGKLGKVNLELLSKLFHNSVLTKEGENFLLKTPPRSSDPEWYKIIPELTSSSVSFEDRLRTAEYFSAYIYYHTLSFIDNNLLMPCHFAVCGGGWKNPISYDHFKGLVAGDFINNPVLAEHQELFSSINNRMKQSSNSISCDFSEAYGFDGTAMEARIFADAAFCRLKGEPFSLPSTTGATKPTVAGIIRYPNKDINKASSNISDMIKKYNSENLTLEKPEVFDSRWSRASAGWSNKI
jgi:anhydro-N-acetylmuramic acid kinase